LGVHAAFEEGQTLEISIEELVVGNRDSGVTLKARPVPLMLLDLMLNGGLYSYLEKQGLIGRFGAA
jgi:hypothetical protein